MQKLSCCFAAILLITLFARTANATTEAYSGFGWPLPYANYNTSTNDETCSGGWCNNSGNSFNEYDSVSYTSPVYHPGEDWNVPGVSGGTGTGCNSDKGLNVVAVADGDVVYVNTANWSGIVIKHIYKGLIYYSQYGHIANPAVSINQSVSKGQIIAKIGNTGASCAHLHFEIRKSNHPNPTGEYWTYGNNGLGNSTNVNNWYEDPDTFIPAHPAYTQCYGAMVSLAVGGSTVSDSICNGYYQQYSFSITSGRQYKVTVTPSTGDPDLYLHNTNTVSNVTYTYKSNSGGTSADNYTITATSSGTYYAAVFGYAAGTSNYTIKVEDVTPACYDSMVSISVGASAFSDSICNGYYQQYSFSITSGRQYKVTVTPSTGDPDLYLHNTNTVSNVTYTYKSNSGGTSADNYTIIATSSGTYYAAVYGYAVGTSNYTIKVEDVTPSDTTPNSFTFTDQTSVELSTAVTSNPISVSGINAAASISITGGTYSINGGAYTSASGTVSNGNTVTVKVTSSGSYSTAANATLTIGGVSDTFSVTTKAAPSDTTPNSFTFTDQTSVELSTAVTSNPISVSGINAAASISITGGTYSINGGAYTSASGTVSNGNTVTVKVTSSGSYSTAANATLTIGGVSDTFSATTKAAPCYDPMVSLTVGVTAISDAICNGYYQQYSFSITSGRQYKVTVTPSTGDPDLYLHNTNTVSNVTYTYKSNSGGTSADNYTIIATSSGTYYAAVYGYAVGTSNYTIKVEDVTPSDTTPDSFTFTDQTSVELSTAVTSNPISVSGINAAASISITGGTYSINGGAYTSASGTVSNGNTVTVRVTSSGSYSTAVNAILTIGGVSDTFSVTTKAAPPDTTPNSFTFTDQTSVELSTAVTSNPISVSEINAAASISITGGTYSINGGAYTSASGTVSNGNTVTVKVTSSGSYSTVVNATLAIGGVSDTFSVTTKAAPSDVTPDTFTFSDQTSVELSTAVTSNPISVSGINGGASIAITGGTYSINGGAYTSASGTVSNGNTVTVKVTSSGSYSTAVNATLAIGGVSDTFSVTTKAAPSDVTPDTFTFSDQTSVELSTAVTSNPISVSGINAAASISITGGTYSINGGAYTSASGTVSNGNTVTVKVTSSGSYSTAANATLTIGGVSDTFSAATKAAPPDTTTDSPRLPDTGQTTCYDGAGNVISCPAPGAGWYGQDAQYQGNARSYAGGDNGTVTDQNTGLMWQQADDRTTRNWNDSVGYCETLSLGGHDDWRLPGVFELITLSDYGRLNPAIDTTYFSVSGIADGSSNYWSSTSNAGSTSSAWVVSFYYGSANGYNKTNSYYVRCVRDGRSGAFDHLTSWSFASQGDGTVAANGLGLEWQQTDDGVERNWHEALGYCEDLTLGGHDDWRLPNILELQTLTDFTKSYPGPTSDVVAFPGVRASDYWSSTSYASQTSDAWHVHFGYGYGFINAKTDSYYVRCVRDGLSGPPWTPITGTQYNMVVSGTAYDGESYATAGDWIAAFGPGGESDCRALYPVGAFGAYYLTIVGNNNGEKITYKLSRQNDGQQFNADKSITFQADATTLGVELQFGCMQTLNFISGWNWISLNVLPQATDPAGFLGANSGLVDQVKTQSTSMTNATGIGWIGDDANIFAKAGQGSMFKVKVSGPFTLQFSGTCIPVDTPITLIAGWSWVAYLPGDCSNAESSLGSILEDLYQVKGQSKSKTQIPGLGLAGDLNEMCSGSGFTIKMDRANSLVYPGN